MMLRLSKGLGQIYFETWRCCGSRCAMEEQQEESGGCFQQGCDHGEERGHCDDYGDVPGEEVYLQGYGGRQQ